MWEWETIPRALALVGCAFALWILALDGYRFRKTMNIKTQDHWLALSVWVFIGGLGAVEAITRGLSIGPTGVLKLLAVALTLRALLRTGEVVAERKQAPWKREE